MKYKKKILIITSRYPFPTLGGDKLRISEIIKYLSKKNNVDLISIGIPKKKLKIGFIKKQYIFKNNIFNIFLQILISFIKGEPLQVGMYYVPDIKKKIEKIHKNYDVIICHLIRTAKYIPTEFDGTKILEMTDLISKNYSTVLSSLNFFNPIKIIYKYEYSKLEEFEYKQIKIFNKTILVNIRDIKNYKYIRNIRNKINIIGNGTNLKKNIYLNKKKKKYLVFYGNINSLANFTACLDFVNKIYPAITRVIPNLKFKIIGNSSFIIRWYFYLKGISCKNNIKNISNNISNAIAGICNVNIQSGLQNKILDYTGSGLPAIINSNSNNFKKFNYNDVLVYKNKQQLIQYLIKLLNDKKFSNTISKNCYTKTKKYYRWEVVLKKYNFIF
jgi:glycosyltransferase involved in cell wall biosynthesis